MLYEYQEIEYKKLKEDLREYLHYEKWRRGFIRVGLFFIFFLLVLGVFDSALLKTGYSTILGWAFFSVVAIVVIGDNYLERLTRHNYPKSGRLATYFVFGIIDNINRCLDPEISTTPQLKNKFRQRATDNASELFSVIEKDWTVGDFELGEKVGKTVSTFKELLSKRLIPIVKEGKPEPLLKKANDVFWQISAFLGSPTVEGLNLVNNTISKDFTEGTGHRDSQAVMFFRYLKSHTLLTHVLSLLGIIGLALLVYYIGTTYLGIPTDSAYDTAITFLGALIVVYITITVTLVPRRKEK